MPGRLASPFFCQDPPRRHELFAFGFGFIDFLVRWERVQELHFFDLCKSHLLWVLWPPRQLVKEFYNASFFPRLQVVPRHSWLERTDAQQSVILQLLLQAFQHCRDQLCAAVTGTKLTRTFSSVRNF